MTTPIEKIPSFLPAEVRQHVDAALETVELFAEMKNPRVLRAMAPSAMRVLVLQRGQRGEPTDMPAHRAARFDWSYPHDQPEMHALYERAKLGLLASGEAAQ